MTNHFDHKRGCPARELAVADNKVAVRPDPDGAVVARVRSLPDRGVWLESAWVAGADALMVRDAALAAILSTHTHAPCPGLGRSASRS